MLNNLYNPPWTQQSDPLYGKFYYGAQGVTTGNKLIDPLMMMMLGPSMTPRPNQVANSMLQAAMLRRRSLDYMALERHALTNNAFTNAFGGVNPSSMMSMAMWAANGMTGGAEHGIISRGLNMVLGGNPIVAQQKLYAGLNGITTQAAFGLRGETSLATTSRMMDALSGHFHKPIRKMSADELVATGDSIRSKFDKLGLSEDLKKDLEKALTDALSGQPVSAAIEKITSGLGEKITKEITAGLNKASFAAKFGRYGGIDYGKTYGLSMQDFTGGFVTASSLGLLTHKRGTSLESAMGSFIEGGAGGVMDASRILFGGESGADYMRNLNQFLGVSRVNLANQGDITAVKKSLFGLQAAAISAGLDPSVMGQLVAQYKSFAQEGPLGGAIGGLEASVGVRNALSRAQSIMAVGGDQMHNFMRRNGGSGGIIDMALQSEVAIQSGTPARFIYSMLGAAEAQGNTAMVERIRQYIAKGEHSARGLQDLQREFAQSTGTSRGAMAHLLRDEVYAARGMEMASKAAANGDNSLDAGTVGIGINMATMENQVSMIARGDKGMMRDYWDALGEATNADDFRDILERKWHARTGNYGLTQHLRPLINNAKPMWGQIAAKYNKNVRAFNKANEAFVAGTAAYSDMLQQRFGELKESPQAQLMRMLVDGRMSSAGIRGVVNAFSGRISDVNQQEALLALANGDEGAFLQKMQGPAGALLRAFGVDADVMDELEKYAGSTIDEIKKRDPNSALVRLYNEQYENLEHRKILNTIFGEEGRVSKNKLMAFAKKQLAMDIGMKELRSTDAYKNLLAETERHLSSFAIDHSPELKKVATDAGAYKDGKWNIEKLLELNKEGVLDKGPWEGSGVASTVKTMAAKLDEVMNPENSNGSNTEDAMMLLVKAITDTDGGLAKILRDLITALNSLNAQ